MSDDLTALSSRWRVCAFLPSSPRSCVQAEAGTGSATVFQKACQAHAHSNDHHDATPSTNISTIADTRIISQLLYHQLTIYSHLASYLPYHHRIQSRHNLLSCSLFLVGSGHSRQRLCSSIVAISISTNQILFPLYHHSVLPRMFESLSSFLVSKLFQVASFGSSPTCNDGKGQANGFVIAKAALCVGSLRIIVVVILLVSVILGVVCCVVFGSFVVVVLLGIVCGLHLFWLYLLLRRRSLSRPDPIFPRLV